MIDHTGLSVSNFETDVGMGVGRNDDAGRQPWTFANHALVSCGALLSSQRNTRLCQ